MLTHTLNLSIYLSYFFMLRRMFFNVNFKNVKYSNYDCQQFISECPNYRNITQTKSNSLTGSGGVPDDATALWVPAGHRFMREAGITISDIGTVLVVPAMVAVCEPSPSGRHKIPLEVVVITHLVPLGLTVGPPIPTPSPSRTR